MATLLAIFSGKKCVARCDRNCYRRGSRREHCACGGSNKGLGIELATRNTRDHWFHWLEDWRAEHPRVEVTKVIRLLIPIHIRPLQKAA